MISITFGRVNFKREGYTFDLPLTMLYKREGLKCRHKDCNSIVYCSELLYCQEHYSEMIHKDIFYRCHMFFQNFFGSEELGGQVYRRPEDVILQVLYSAKRGHYFIMLEDLYIVEKGILLGKLLAIQT
jgi:hypothetical protein